MAKAQYLDYDGLTLYNDKIKEIIPDVLVLTNAQYQADKAHYDSLNSFICITDKGTGLNSENIGYDNGGSGLAATDVQSAIDEIVAGGGAGGGGASSLAGLTDTYITNPTSGQVLYYNGSKWINKNNEGGGSGGGSTVSFTPSTTSGNVVGVLTIDGIGYTIYSKEYSNATQSTSGLMSAADKIKLDSITLVEE